MPPQPPIMRRYPTDAHYTADAAAMQRAGWRVISVAREPSGAIVATYTRSGAHVAAAPSLVARAAHRDALTLSAALGGALILVLVGVLILAHVLADAPGVSPRGSLQPSGLLGSAFATTTAWAMIATQTPTSQPAHPVTGAHLGGPISDWLARYGGDAQPRAVYQWKGAIDGHAVELTVNVSLPADAIDGQSRAVIIDITDPDQPGSSAGSPWSAATEAALVASFLPPDAVFQQDLPATSDLGPDHLYRSPQLSASLVASLFQSSATGHQLMPGTFDWVCSTQQPMCELGVGTNS